MPEHPTITVIVPVFNEERRIARQLKRLTRTDGFDEIIVVDGGSVDQTKAEASRFDAVRVLSSPKGRAFQMNVGADEATSDLLLFLHADVVLPDDAVYWIQTTMGEPETIAGAFRTWTVADFERHWVEPFLHFADFRSRYSDLPYGDQGIFLRRVDFLRVGRYRSELPLFEDLDLSVRLSRMGNIVTVPSTVLVSGRRFIARPIVNMLWVNFLPLFYRMGIPAEVLVRVYANYR